MNIKTIGDKGLTIVGYVMIFFVTGLLLTYVAQGFFGNKEPQVSYAEKTYQSAVYNLCVAEQALANAKLSDYFDGFIDLSDEDILRLKSKRENDCPLS